MYKIIYVKTNSLQEQIQYWSGCDPTGSNCKLRDVHSVETFWDWMQQDLIPLAFTEYEDGYPTVASIRTSVRLRRIVCYRHRREQLQCR